MTDLHLSAVLCIIFGMNEKRKYYGKVFAVAALVMAAVGIYTAWLASVREAERKEAMRLAYQEVYDSLTIDFKDDMVLEYGTNLSPYSLVESYEGLLWAGPKVDTKRTGSYIVTYELEGKDETYDREVRREYTKVVTVEDTQEPVIETEKDEIVLRQGKEYDLHENIVRAEDPVDGDLEVSFETEFNAEEAGEYPVTAAVTDENGNTAEAQFTVIVKSKPSLSPNFDQIYDYVTDEMGLNSAAACGILANIARESSFDPSVGGDFYGLCQWGGGRRSELHSWCKDNGYDASTVKGQLAFMEHELNTGYTSCLEGLRNVEDTEDGAAEAALIFVHRYEKAASAGDRASLARTYFNL